MDTNTHVMEFQGNDTHRNSNGESYESIDASKLERSYS
jgi:hypothetical protein